MRSLLFWLLLMTPTMTVALPLARPVAMPIGPGPDRMAAGVARMVGSILEFTRWPTDRPVVRMCMAGAVAHGDQLGEISLTNGARIATVALAADEAAPAARCDALYLGSLDALVRQRLIAAVRGNAVVTIAEDDRDCAGGAMFCLLFAPQTLSFQLNIDAVSRSAVRVDPRVLRVAKGGY